MVNESIERIITLGEQFVKLSQEKVLLTYPTVPAQDEGVIIIQPFSDGIVFSYNFDDEPLGILLKTGRVWSYQEYAIVRIGELFDEGTWTAIRNALEEVLLDASD